MTGKISNELAGAMEELNNLLNDWEGLSYKPNGVREVENVLEKFYDNNMIETGDVGRFDTEAQYNEEQIEELTDIYDRFKDEDIKFDDFQKKFEKAQGKHGIETIEDYAEFIDKKTIYEKEAVSGSKMSYYEYEALVEKAKKKNSKWYSEKRINKMIETAMKKGKEGTDLYEYMADKFAVDDNYTEKGRQRPRRNRTPSHRPRRNRSK